jgi:hypothetical protein
MDNVYKIIELDLDGGPNKVKVHSTNTEWSKAKKAAGKIAISELEDLLNKHCTEENDWRLDSIQTIPFNWGGTECTKTVVVLKNMGHF